MIKSMTGFGRCEFADENRKFTVEIKAVNHRYLDVNIKMLKKLNFFESAIRTLLKEYMERGKVDIFINCEDYTQDNVSLKYNEALAAQYLTYLNSMAEKFGLDNDIRVSTLSKYPDVFTMEEQGIDEKSLWLGLEKVIRGAAEQFVESRGVDRWLRGKLKNGAAAGCAGASCPLRAGQRCAMPTRAFLIWRDSRGSISKPPAGAR